MKKQMMMMMLAFALLVNISFINGELYFYDSVSKDTVSSTVRYTASYVFQDTSESGVGRNKDISILLYSEVEALPFNFSGVYPVIVDYCNYTITHDINLYDGNGDFLNTTSETTQLNFQNQPLNVTKLTFKLKSRDSLRAKMECHYTDSNYLYVENILVGEFFTYFPSFECNGCEKYTLEELSHLVETQDELVQNEFSVYERIQQVLGWNYQIWLIASWIIKIAYIFLSVFLLFSGVYYFYKLLREFSYDI